MAARNPYIDFLIEQFAPLGEITGRRMFGGHVLYCDGTVFALVANNAVYLKTDDINRPDFVERGFKAFRPFEDQEVVIQYYEAPPEIFEDPDAMKKWAGGAVGAGKRAPVKKKRPRKATSKRA